MGLVLATTAGLVIWIVLWSIGAKGFDSFMITTVIVLIGAALKIVVPKLPGSRTR